MKPDNKIADPGRPESKTLLSAAPRPVAREESVESGGEYTMARIPSMYETDGQAMIRLERERSEADASSQADTSSQRESNIDAIRAEVDYARELLGLPPKLRIQQRASLPTHRVVAEQGLEPSAVFQQGLESSANSMCGQIAAVPFSTKMPPDAAWQLPSPELLALAEVAWSSRSHLVYEGKSESESTREPSDTQGELPAVESQVPAQEKQKARLKEEIAALRGKVRQQKNSMLAEKG